MKILPTNKKSIKQAIKILHNGGVIVYPTETTYGIGCDATNKKAVLRIFKIKKRSKANNLPIICATKKMVKDFFKISKKEQELAKKYWPGPLSIVLSLRGAYSRRGNLVIGTPVRVSSDKIVYLLSFGLKKPITATSANISGDGPFYNAKDVYDNFKNRKYQPDLILDSGRLKKNKPSTIVELKDDNIFVIRRGEIKL